MSFGFGFGLPSWQTLSGGFNPSSLFVGGVQGTWYDPSDASTLFSDTAGTTPSPAPGAGALSVVGLMLDKSQGLALGSELVTNGNFDTNVTGWTLADGSASITWQTGGFARVTMLTNTGSGAYQDVTLATGNVAKIVVRAKFSGTSGNTYIVISPAGTFTGAIASYTVSSTSYQDYVFNVPASSNGYRIYLKVEFTGAVLDVDSVSVKQIAGNHAISYNTTTARPELSARVNLLTYSEQFDNAAWTKTNTTINATKVSDPTGSTTAQQIFETTTNAGHFVLANGFSAVANVQFTSSVYVKANGRTKGQVVFYDAGGAGSGAGVNFDLATETVTNYFPFATGTVVAKSITPFGSGWYRVSVTSTTTTSSGAGTFLVRFLDDAGNISYAGDVTKGLIVWGADLRPANIGTSVPAYQRIADQYTYDSSGFPRYLVFNGTASGMYTPANLNLSGTDKATVFAGVRKLVDDSDRTLVELSATVNTNNGSFGLFAPSQISGGYAGKYAGSLRGTAQSISQLTSYPAPISNVISAKYDIAGATIAAESVYRINAATPTETTNSTLAGTGNFGSYPLYIGSRNNASLWFNGYLYSLIVVGAASTAAQISSTESWINVKEGGVY